jgi:hypothetical protein
MTLMPEFRDQLLTAASRQVPTGSAPVRSARPARPLGRLRTPLGAVASILVVITIAVAALLTLGHGHRADTVVGPSAAARDEVTATRAQLLHELGVLRGGHAPVTLSQGFLIGTRGPGSRRNVTGTAPLPGLSSRGPVRLDRSLVRILRPDGYTVALLPVVYARPGGSSLTGTHRTTGLASIVEWPKGRGLWNARSSVSGPVTPSAIAAHGSTDVEYVNGSVNRAFVIVPDGVAHVELSDFRLTGSAATGDPAATIAAASAPVHHNVATITLRGVTPAAFHRTANALPEHGGIFRSHHCRMTSEVSFVSASARMTWTSATGSTIRTITVPIGLDAFSSFDPGQPLAGCHPR